VVPGLRGRPVDDQAETNEDNNTRAVQIHVLAGNLPDLDIRTAEILPTPVGQWGGLIDVAWTVKTSGPDWP